MVFYTAVEATIMKPQPQQGGTHPDLPDESTGNEVSRRAGKQRQLPRTH